MVKDFCKLVPLTTLSIARSLITSISMGVTNEEQNDEEQTFGELVDEDSFFADHRGFHVNYG